MVIDPEGKPVAEQMWHSVQNSTTYAKELVEPLLKTMGVQAADMSPFCRKFESLADLKEEYTKYQAKSFVFNGKCGTGMAGAEEDTGSGVPEASPEAIVLERVKAFAGDMLRSDEDSNDKDEESEGEKEVGDSDTTPDQAPTDHEELLIKFKNVSASTSADLLQNVLSASMCLEKADKGSIKGSVNGIRKAKSLVGRWLERSQAAETSDKPSDLSGETVIERDTVVSAEVAVGRGASSTKVLKQYRVLDIHDKYYNKWFMSKDPRKVFGKDDKYKLKVRMQEVSAVQEYQDVDLNDKSYKKAAISRLLTDGETKYVVGKLKRI